MSENICEQLPLIVGICCMENLIKLFRNQIGLLFLLKHKITLFYLLSFVFINFNTRCHSASLIVKFCYPLSFVDTCFHSLSLPVPLVVTCCHSFYHSLSLVVIRYATRCHLLSCVVNRCTSRLSLYKLSHETIFYKKKTRDWEKLKIGDNVNYC